jgi:predicted anti-sigma-YlaC factor YlaD
MGDTNRERAGQGDAREHLNDEVLSAYLDTTTAGLSPAARTFAEAHLAACAECRVALEDLEATLAMLHTVPQIAPRRSFILTPEAAAAVGGPRLPRRTPLWALPARWASALAVLVFVVTIGLDLGNRPTSPAVPAAAATAAATATVDTASTTPCRLDPTLCGVQAAGLTPTIFPTPTAVPKPVTPQPQTMHAQIDWRPAQVTSGLIALLGAFFGFLLPPYLRRRNTSTAA